MAHIRTIHAQEILDSRGNPTVEAEVILDDGTKAWSQVPSGASTGEHEALELRDGDPSRYGGKGVTRAVANVTDALAAAVTGMDASDQQAIDAAMIAADGTPNKARLGANAILAVSLATCRAAAISADLRLYEYIARLHGTTQPSRVPVPMFNVINGGKHADSGLAVQEYMVVPRGIATFAEQLRAGAEIFHALREYLAERQYATGVGDEGGFAPRLPNNTAPLDAIAQAASAAGYAMGAHIGIAVDVAANSFYRADDPRYVFTPEEKDCTTEELFDIYARWVSEKHVMSIEDGVTENDWDGWRAMHERFAASVMLVGDDLLVTDAARVRRAAEVRACTAALIKPNQIGTLSETLACVRAAQENRMKVIVSHRSGETIDDFIADLAVGVGADFIKSGSLSRSERLCKYNRLLSIERRIMRR